ncbi:reverse transcriptase domain-containing protein [Gimesia maris]|uniref:reverse transcriptase domain-containing protein n=1 Tax=Gimesia maris TaxID=122 RepID=UPI0030DCDF7D
MYSNSFKTESLVNLTNDAVSYHTGTRNDFYQRCIFQVQKASRSGWSAIKEIGPFLPKWCFDSRMLRIAWDRLAKDGGQAPGPNGRRYHDYYDQDVWELLATIKKDLKAGTYQPGPVKWKWIPKVRSNPRRGKRRIALLNIEDRVVQRAIVEVVQPLLDSLFGTNVLGFRPGHDRMDALVLAQKTMAEKSRFVLITEDIKDAFDNVPHERLMEIVATYIRSPELQELISKFVRVGSRKKGIPQGGPLSPLLLNLYVYHNIVRKWKPEPDQELADLICYADDILLICRSQDDAANAWEKLSKLSREAGLPLKYECHECLADLQRKKLATWLGYSLRYRNQSFQTKIDKSSWDSLKDSLELAHEKPDSPLLAISIVEGWLSQLGPCFLHENRGDVIQKILDIAAEYGFDELPGTDTLKFIWLQAYARWVKRKARFRGDVPHRIEVRANPDEFYAPTEGLCVDAAWNDKKRLMEYRGVWLDDGSEAFRVDPISTGSNNIGEFLAIVRGLQLLKRKGIDCPVYSDSQTSISWLKSLRINSKSAREQKISPRVYQRITRAVLWLTRHTNLNPVLKWNTEDWGEIPADYGRKS